jgi:predicted DCC family thiol-disulfide oxidoreductase YuxK
MKEPPAGATIVLYDGVCALCNGAITFILQRERRGTLYFASLQGEFGTRFLQTNGRDPANLDTLYLVANYGAKNQKLMDRSDAALNIARKLDGAWSLFALGLAVPRPVRNWFYDRVANNRYRMFGKHDQCVMPRPEWKARFID